MIENLKTPSELLELYPDCDYIQREIGYLLMLGLVKGKKTRSSCLICSVSFGELLEYKAMNGQKKAVLRVN